MRKFIPTPGHNLIYKFIDYQSESQKSKYFWAKELKIAKKLISIYPYEFLINLREPFGSFKMKSLCWFISSEGKKFLTVQYFEYQKNNPNLIFREEKVTLETDKIGEDVKIETKPKTLHEFLEMFKK